MDVEIWILKGMEENKRSLKFIVKKAMGNLMMLFSRTKTASIEDET